MYVCVRVSMYTKVDRVKALFLAGVYACVGMHACMYAKVYHANKLLPAVYACMCVCMHACVYVCMHACVYVQVEAYTYMY